MNFAISNFTFEADETGELVSALFYRPPSCRHGVVLAHGAGAGMRHAFLEDFAQGLAKKEIATFRYQFPYMEQGRRAPNPQPRLLSTVISAIQHFAKVAPDLHCVAGGKSMGGRMTSIASSKWDLDQVHGLLFLGFPLHPIKKPGVARAQHLMSVHKPMLFLQGTRDKLAKPDLLQPVLDDLGSRIRVWWLESGDHSFKVLKSSGLRSVDVMDQLTQNTADWIKTVCPRS